MLKSLFFCLVLLLLFFLILIISEVRSVDDVVHRFLFAGCGPYSCITANLNKEFAFQSYVGSSDGTAILHTAASSQPSATEEPVTLIFYLHGNAGSIDFNWYNVIRDMSIIAQQTTNCVIATFDYRKFGRSTSYTNPTPTNSVEDAARVLEFLQTTFKPTKTLLYGRSLGGAVALHLNDICRFPLFLEAPFLGESSVKFLPRWFPLKERFSCKHQLQRSLAEITVVLAEWDHLIDNDTIIELLPQSIIVPDVGHNDVCFDSLWTPIFKQWVQKNCD